MTRVVNLASWSRVFLFVFFFNFILQHYYELSFNIPLTNNPILMFQSQTLIPLPLQIFHLKPLTKECLWC